VLEGTRKDAEWGEGRRSGSGAKYATAASPGRRVDLEGVRRFGASHNHHLEFDARMIGKRVETIGPVREGRPRNPANSQKTVHVDRSSPESGRIQTIFRYE